MFITKAEMEYAYKVAKERHYQAESRGKKSRVDGDTEHQIWVHYKGCLGEIAARKLLKIPTTLGVNEYKEKPDLTYKGKPVEVKTVAKDVIFLSPRERNDDILIIRIHNPGLPAERLRIDFEPLGVIPADKIPELYDTGRYYNTSNVKIVNLKECAKYYYK